MVAEFADQPHARLERSAAGDLAGRNPAPRDHAVLAERKGLVGFAGELAEPPRHLGRHRPLDRAAQGPGLQRRVGARRLEMNAGQAADDMALDRHLAVGGDAAEHRTRMLMQRAHQRAGAPVDEALHQRLCRVSESRSSSARARPCQPAGSASQSERLAT